MRSIDMQRRRRRRTFHGPAQRSCDVTTPQPLQLRSAGDLTHEQQPCLADGFSAAFHFVAGHLYLPPSHIARERERVHVREWACACETEK